MASTDTNELCAEVSEHLAEVLDGTASPRLLEHLLECDTCRDVRHDAEQARQAIAAAGLDHRAPADLEARVLAALDAQAATESSSAAAAPTLRTTEASAPAPKTPRIPAASATGTARGTKPLVAVLVTGLAVAAAVAIVAWRKPPAADAAAAWSGKVERVVSSRGGTSVEVCDAAGTGCRASGTGAPLPAGARVKTDAATRAELALSDGSRVTLDRSTELALLAEGARHARLLQGTLVADVAHVKNEAHFELPAGAVTVHGTKFSLRAQGQAASVDVSRGSVTLSDARRRSVRVVEGETGRLEPDAEPSVAYSSSLSDTLGWSDEAFESDRQSLSGRGLGELRAKKPGQDGERSGAVTLASHHVRVRIAGVVARTEVEEIFENQTDDVLEGIYRFPLPPDAQIERLALDVDGKLEEGAFVDRDRAAAIFRGAIVNATPKQPKPLEEIIWVPGPWRDPGLLEWQRGGRFELRIFPIPKRGSRRIVLAYTEVVKPSAGARRYTYPLAYDPSGTTRIGRFELDLEVRGNDRDFGVRPLGYSLVTRPSAADVTSLTLEGGGFVPTGDLSVEYALPERASELTAWTYFEGRGGARPLAGSGATGVKDDVSPYVALALRPKLPRLEHESGRAVALVVDASRSMLGASYARASELAVRLAGELDESDRVTVLACGVDCQLLGEAGLVPGATTAAAVRRFLQGITPEDASDLVGSVERALGTLRGAVGLARRVVYLGDGAPTVGQVRPGSIERAVRRGVTRVPASVVAVAVGAESDGVTLDALARGGDGVLLPYTPGRSTADMTYGVLAASYGNALGSVSVTLPEGLGAIAPVRLSSIPAGGEAFVFARMNNLEVSGDVVLRGSVRGKPFEQRYPVVLRASGAAGNAFVPRLYAAARLADLEREGTDASKTEAIALSTEFSVASRYTSLLVLESQAMFRAFGLAQASGGGRFTGDETAESTNAEGAESVDAPDDLAKDESESAPNTVAAPAKAKADLGTLGRRGAGQGADAESSGLVFDDRPAWGPSVVNPAPTAAPPPAPKPAAPSSPAANAEKKRSTALEPELLAPREDPFLLEQPRRRMIPMRRIWERQGEVLLDRFAAAAASGSAIANVERMLADNPNRRDSVKKLFTLYLQAGELERAATLAERWSDKEPLDPEALTARADVLAARGERALAIRVLGSVLDARPGDIASEKRLARLERWAGRPALGCRFSIAIAELRSGDAALLADAVRCARETFDGAVGDELLEAAAPATRDAAERLLQGPPPDNQALRGDLRLEAEWRGGGDLDLALVDPDGHRVSWLGAATRGIITARDVTSESREGLALSGTRPGDYAIELVRSGPGGPSTGEVTISVAGAVRRVPFSFDGTRTRLGVARVSMRSRLVPL
jgi:vault protein inter-alpha-trypsin-like protein/FecR-like protein/VWA domain-containing protein